MKCNRFDQMIDLALEHYRADRVSVKLLAVRSTAAPSSPHPAISVTVAVTMLVAQLPGHADTWHYGQDIRRTTEPRPSGMHAIDRSRLIGMGEVARSLADYVALSEAAVELYWPVLPAVCEPTYHIDHGCTSLVIGAYSGNFYHDWTVRRQLSAIVSMLS